MLIKPKWNLFVCVLHEISENSSVCFSEVRKMPLLWSKPLWNLTIRFIFLLLKPQHFTSTFCLVAFPVHPAFIYINALLFNLIVWLFSSSKLSFTDLSAVQCCGLKGLCIITLAVFCWRIGFCVLTSNVENTGEISGTSIKASPEPAQVVSDCFLKHLLMSLNHHLEVKQIHCIAHQNTLSSRWFIPEAHNPPHLPPPPVNPANNCRCRKAYPYADKKGH